MGSKELNAHDGAYYRRWATVYGDAMVTLIDRILRGVKHEEQAYNSCKGILHLCNDVPRHIVEEAAQTCIDASACKYFLHNQDTFLPEPLVTSVGLRSPLFE